MIRILPCHRGSSYHCVTWSSFLSTSVENFPRSVSKTSHFSTIDPNTKDDVQQYVLSTFENLFSNTFLFFSLNTFFTTWSTLFSSSMVLALAIFFTSFLSFIHPKRQTISDSVMYLSIRLEASSSNDIFVLHLLMFRWWMPLVHCSDYHYLPLTGCLKQLTQTLTGMDFSSDSTEHDFSFESTTTTVRLWGQ